jgi:hypothetical protein
MGLLDDAIRDHLDLKRRRGADPADVERAEREALGPVRRDPFEHGPDDFEPASMPDEGARAYDHEEELYDDDGYGADEEWEEDFEEEPGEPHLAPGEMPEAAQDELSDRTTVMDHEYLEEPQPPVADDPAAPPSHPAGAGAGDETMQYDVEEALASEESQAKPAPEWVEQSDQWVEQSEEWVEPGHEPFEPGHEPFEPGHERAHDLEPEEPPPHGHPEESPPSSADPEADHDQLWFEQRPPRDFDADG